MAPQPDEEIDAALSERASLIDAWLTVVVFIGLCLAPLVVNLMVSARRSGPVISETENRYLAEWPRPGSSLAGWLAFPTDAERYYDDHLGLRTWMLRGISLVELRLFGTSPSDELIVGKDGWFFFGDEQAVAHYRGVAPLSDAELKRWERVLLGRRNHLARLGIPFILVLVPEKNLVYPEFMPDSLPRFSERHPLDQLAKHLREQTDLTVVDLRGPLLRAKARRRVYHKTDNHWNDVGAYVGYRQIHQALVGALPSFEGNAPVAVRPGSHVTAGMGLTSIIGLSPWIHEERLDMTPLTSRHSVAVEHRARYDRRVQRQLPIALGREHSGLPHAVMFRDSFANALIPYLSENFERILYVWDRDVLPEVIAREKPDVVIQEIVSRFLGRRPLSIMELEARSAKRLGASAEASHQGGAGPSPPGSRPPILSLERPLKAGG